MRDKVALFPEYEQSPSGLEMLLRDLKKNYGIQGTADKLKLSRSTISYWIRKLVLFRNFAGQSTETILRLLHDVAQCQGVEYAASLVDVSPVTLSRSFERLDEPEVAAQAA
jgi:DNA-binding transcriptional LysR family regulator